MGNPGVDHTRQVNMEEARLSFMVFCMYIQLFKFDIKGNTLEKLREIYVK